MHTVHTYLFFALACEAKPFISALGLKKITTIHAFDIYQHQHITLTVTGVGKTAMATAVGYTLALFSQQTPLLLVNIGIAGHATADLGSLWLAKKITDADTGRAVYPQLQIPSSLCASASLCCVSHPTSSYAPDILYDMEAAAFYDSAARFTSSEFILSLKVISDNALHGQQGINAKQVSLWLAAQQAAIMATIQYAEQLAGNLSAAMPTVDLMPWLGQLHFSVSEQIQLKGLLQQWQVLSGGANLPFTAAQCQSASAVLHLLQQQIAQLPVQL